MTVEAAAKYLEIGTSTLYALVEQGRIAHYRIGARGRGKIHFDRADLDEFKRACRVEAKDAMDPDPIPPPPRRPAHDPMTVIAELRAKNRRRARA